jgi:hypothetical protein
MGSGDRIASAGVKEGFTATRADRSTLHPSAFVGVDSDGTVYIVAHRSEMGTASASR